MVTFLEENTLTSTDSEISYQCHRIFKNYLLKFTWYLISHGVKINETREKGFIMAEKFKTKDYLELVIFAIGVAAVFFLEPVIEHEMKNLIGPAALLIITFGIILAIRASERAVEAFDQVGKRLKISPYQAGVLSSLASNLPELAIGFFAVINNQIEFAISLAVVASGFNVLLLGLIIWMGAAKSPNGKFRVPDDIINTEVPLLRVGVVILGGITFIGVIEFILEVFALQQGSKSAAKFLPTLPVEAAVLMVVIYLIYIYLLLRNRGLSNVEDDLMESARRATTNSQPEKPTKTSQDAFSTSHLVTLSFFGLLGIILAGEFISGSVEAVSIEFNINAFVIAFLVGASAALPEHAIGVVSARREGGFDLGLGNLMAGVIQNFMFILGVIVIFAAVIGGLPGVPLVHEITLGSRVEFVPFILLQLGFGALVIFLIKSSITDDHEFDIFEGITIFLGQLFVFILFLKLILLF